MGRIVLALSMSSVGSAELDEVAPTFRELLTGSDVSFVQACVSGVDLQAKKVSVVGAVSDDLDGFVISDNQEEREFRGLATDESHRAEFWHLLACFRRKRFTDAWLDPFRFSV